MRDESKGHARSCPLLSALRRVPEAVRELETAVRDSMGATLGMP